MTKFNPYALINYSALSEALGLDRSAISRNRCPAKYKKNVDRLAKHILTWKQETENPELIISKENLLYAINNFKNQIEKNL